ncbi:MAG: AAA family ATPase, partial [Lachnospiraceae bacterium]|nr:AAA family ATPase [Lachnospiraceae bacterium]
MNDLYLNRISISKEIPAGNYLSKLPVVKLLKEMGGIELAKKVTFLVGENGVGKSTLIEGIAVAMGFNPEGGTVNSNFSTRESHSDLHNYLTVSRGYKR